MRRSLAVDNPFRSGGFEIKNNGFVTKVYHTQGLDLNVEQTNPKGETVYFSHYSNPGINFFNGLMKFLFVHRIPIPIIQKPVRLAHDEFKAQAKSDSNSFGAMKFPISYAHYYDISGTGEQPKATLTPLYEHAKPPVLQLTSSQGEIIITPKMAQTMIRKIPQMYPGTPSFHIAYTNFLREAKKHPEQIMRIPNFMQRSRAKQLEFGFLKTIKRKRVTRR